MARRIKTFIILFVLAAFGGSILQGPLYAQDGPMPWMPRPGTMVVLSPGGSAAHLKGIVVHPEDPFTFDFIVDRGDRPLSEAQKGQEYKKLIKYFLASLTIPDDRQWVNLSPYEHERIIPDDFGKTGMGRDLLAQDYLLKQMTASLIYPQHSLGQKFWERVYAEARQQHGTANVPVSTFNKVWIMPDDAVIYHKGRAAYVLKNHLRVMLEEDYLSLRNHAVGNQRPIGKDHAAASKIVREIVLPAIEREVNEGQNFAPLRQIYSGMLLAAWFKRTLKQSLLSQVYANQGKVKGIDQDPRTNEAIYQRYLEAYKKGVFNFVQEDTDGVTAQAVPRKYFSGGTEGYGRAQIAVVDTIDAAQQAALSNEGPRADEISVKLGMVGSGSARTDAAMNHKQERANRRQSQPVPPEFNNIVVYHGMMAGLLLKRLRNGGRDARPKVHNFTGQRQNAAYWAGAESRKPGRFVSDDDFEPTLTLEEVDQHLPEDLRAWPGRHDPVVLEFYAYPLFKDGPNPFKDDYIKSLGYTHVEIIFEGYEDFNFLTPRSKRQVIETFDLNPEGTWYPWMDDGWREAFEELKKGRAMPPIKPSDLDTVLGDDRQRQDTLVEIFHAIPAIGRAFVLPWKSHNGRSYAREVHLRKLLEWFEKNFTQSAGDQVGLLRMMMGLADFDAEEVRTLVHNGVLGLDAGQERLLISLLNDDSIRGYLDGQYTKAQAVRRITDNASHNSMELARFFALLTISFQAKIGGEFDLDDVFERKVGSMSYVRKGYRVKFSDQYENLFELLEKAIVSMQGAPAQPAGALPDRGLNFDHVRPDKAMIVSESVISLPWRERSTQYGGTDAIAAAYENMLTQTPHTLRLHDGSELPVVFDVRKLYHVDSEIRMKVTVYPVSKNSTDREELEKNGYGRLAPLRGWIQKSWLTPPPGTLGQVVLTLNKDDKGDPFMLIEENQSSHGLFQIAKADARLFDNLIGWIPAAHSLLISSGIAAGVRHVYALPAELIEKKFNAHVGRRQIHTITPKNIRLHYIDPYAHTMQWIKTKIASGMYAGLHMQHPRDDWEVWQYRGYKDMRTDVDEILRTWQVSPDPLRILDLVNQGLDEDVIEEVGKQQEGLEKFSSPDLTVLKGLLSAATPYFYDIFQKIQTDYPREKILFAARDARILYLFFKVLSQLRGEDSSRYVLVPGSLTFYKNEENFDPEHAARLLQSLKVSPEDVRRGEKYVVIDSGHVGTVGDGFRRLFKAAFHVGGDLSGQIPVRLVGMLPGARGYYPNVEQIMDLGPMTDTLYARMGAPGFEFLQKVRYQNDVAYFLSLAMQNMPQYHGKYARIADYKGAAIAIADQRGAMTNYLMPGGNPDFINPVAALMMDVEMVRQMILHERKLKDSAMASLGTEDDARKVPLLRSRLIAESRRSGYTTGSPGWNAYNQIINAINLALAGKGPGEMTLDIKGFNEKDRELLISYVLDNSSIFTITAADETHLHIDVSKRIDAAMTGSRQQGMRSQDPAMKGGIDMNAAHVNLDIQEDAQGMPAFGRQDLAQLGSMEGLDPVILSIKPASQTSFFSRLAAPQAARPAR